jgi:hypothetical protein
MDVEALARQPHVILQTGQWLCDDLREELRGYGARDGDELADDEQNILRMLWLACGDIIEESAR